MTSDERRVRTDWELERRGVSTAGRIGAFLDVAVDAYAAGAADDAYAADAADAVDADAADAYDARAAYDAHAAHDAADDGNHIAHAQRWAWAWEADA